MYLPSCGASGNAIALVAPAWQHRYRSIRAPVCETPCRTLMPCAAKLASTGQASPRRCSYRKRSGIPSYLMTRQPMRAWQCCESSGGNGLSGRHRAAIRRGSQPSATLRGQIRVGQSTVSAETSCPSRQSGLDRHRRPAWISIQPLLQCHRPGCPIPPRALAPVRRH
jgi:hypothetical protein